MSDLAFFVMETVKAEDGQYLACIAKAGEKGYYLTDWKWGAELELARKIARERNERLGLTEKEALEIQLNTMRSSERRLSGDDQAGD